MSESKVESKVESKILIVEDEAIVAEDIASRLEKMGYTIADIVASGEEAIVAANTTQPDIVLMDIMLQGKIGGIVAARQIYTELNVPVIYLTAYADPKTLKQAKVTNPFGYILKPFKDKELQATIEIARSRHEKEVQVRVQLQTVELQREIADTRNQEKSDYLSMLSYDFRNSIANIQAWTQLFNLFSNKWPEEKKNRVLKEIETAAERMNVVLSGVKMLSQSEQVENTFNPTRLDGLYLCQTLIDKLQHNFGDKYQIVFKFQGQNDAVGDEHLLWLLLNNLFDNAMKYSPEGSEICLNLSGQSGEICFQVQDCGIGIPEKDIPHLFQPFKRGSNAGLIPGVGLGLAIVKRVVDLHHGTIEINSEEDRGTTVTVKLPVQP